MLLASTGNPSDAHRQTAAFRGHNQRATDGAATDDSNSFHEILHNLEIKDIDAKGPSEFKLRILGDVAHLYCGSGAEHNRR
jgi:hypothetical protein